MPESKIRRIEHLAKIHERGKPEAMKPTAYTSYQAGYRQATEDAAEKASLSAWRALGERIRNQGNEEVKVVV